MTSSVHVPHVTASINCYCAINISHILYHQFTILTKFYLIAISLNINVLCCGTFYFKVACFVLSEAEMNVLRIISSSDVSLSHNYHALQGKIISNYFLFGYYYSSNAFNTISLTSFVLNPLLRTMQPLSTRYRSYDFGYFG